MKTEKRIYITYLYPGSFFPEFSSKRVNSDKLPTEVPSDCFGFYLEETEFAVDGNGREFEGDTKRLGKTYIIGEAIHVDKIPDVQIDGRSNNILKSNISGNSPTKTGIKTHLGNWQMEDEYHVAISPTKFKFGKPELYPNLKK